MGRSALAEAVGAGRPVLTTSVGTLPTPDAALLRARLRAAREAFGFVKFGDNPRARARVSPWAAAAVALEEAVEPIVHVGCRDRNRLALQADLLGGRLLGVANVLCLRGDEIDASDQPEAVAVRDLDVVELVKLAGDAFFVLAAVDRRSPGATSTPRALLERIPFVAAPPQLAARLRRDPGAGVAMASELVAGLLALDGVAGCHLSSLGGEPGPALAVAERVGRVACCDTVAPMTRATPLR